MNTAVRPQFTQLQAHIIDSIVVFETKTQLSLDFYEATENIAVQPPQTYNHGIIWQWKKYIVIIHPCHNFDKGYVDPLTNSRRSCR